MRLSRTVITLGWISLLTDISSEMVYPLLPMFIVGTLHAPAIALGAIEGTAEAIVSVMKAISGWHSDRMKRRVPYIRGGYALSALGKPLLAIAFAWPMVLLARGIDRLGKGLRTSARDAMIADASPPDRRGRAFGFHRAMDTTGALLGTALGALLIHYMPDGFRTIFLIAVIPAALAVVLTLTLRERTERDDEPSGNASNTAAKSDADTLPKPHPQGRGAAENLDDRSYAQSERGANSQAALPRAYWLALALMTFFSLGNGSDLFLLLRAEDVGLATTTVPLAYLLYNATYALSSWPSGMLSDRAGRWRLIGAGWVIYAAVYAGFAMTGKAGVWPLFAVYGVYMGLTQGVGKALIADLAPAARRGFAMGVFHMSTGFAMLAGGVLAGLLWDRVSPEATFWTGAVIALVAAALVPVVAARR